MTRLTVTYRTSNVPRLGARDDIDNKPEPIFAMLRLPVSPEVR
jgi:hypothetical protein